MRRVVERQFKRDACPAGNPAAADDREIVPGSSFHEGNKISNGAIAAEIERFDILGNALLAGIMSRGDCEYDDRRLSSCAISRTDSIDIIKRCSQWACLRLWHLGESRAKTEQYLDVRTPVSHKPMRRKRIPLGGIRFPSQRPREGFFWAINRGKLGNDHY
ncbi:hypothetical protein, partial [Mesorhizobium sanjuanii]|uniref:hypothetical protein n=1 Tax=Mesorhizobium sanjuanii TaxID=2037900 RepID=UPI0013FD3440